MESTVRVIKASNQKNLINDERRKTRVAAYCRVSTDGDEQLNSFASQKAYYKEKIESNPEWTLVDIYADEAITGTKVEIREGFKRMIEDCNQGKIDIVMTKSISRFARNTVDTLNFVRKLKEKKIAVYFEEENINTLTMDGELLLTILSSVAQQEVQNVSEHVKAGLRMKLQRGEMIGFNGCYGYDYDPETKTMSVNKEEAKIIKYIFERYAAGYGSQSISRELRAMGVMSPRNNEIWTNTTIAGIIRNEKYYGDAIFGKTYTIDPISKKRVDNDGNVDVYLLENHHEAIISKELWDKANECLKLRGDVIKRRKSDIALDFKGRYALSTKVICGYCGKAYSRRSHAQTSKEFKAVWKCQRQTKEGVEYCPDSRTIDEAAIKTGFVVALRELLTIDPRLIDSFMKSAEDVIGDKNSSKKVLDMEESLNNLRERQNKLVDLMLDGTLSKDNYTLKSEEIAKLIIAKEKEISEIQGLVEKKGAIEQKLAAIKEKIAATDTILVFDDEVFQLLIDKVVVGGYDVEGNKCPMMVTFIFDPSDRTYCQYKKELGAYTVLKEVSCPYDYYSFDNVNLVYKSKVHHNSFQVKIAIKNE